MTFFCSRKSNRHPGLAVPVYTGYKDDVFMEEEISTQPVEIDETNAVIFTGVE